MKETRKSLEMFFEEIFMERQPFATRIIRPEVGVQLRNDAIDDVVLSLCVSKQSYYARWI